MNKYYVVNCFFSNWSINIPKYTNVSHVQNKKNIPKSNSNNINKIIPLDLRDRKLYLYKDDPDAIFKMDIKNVEVLNNKCLFAKFMMDNFPENIPLTISIDFQTFNYLNPEYKNNIERKMIIKNAVGFAGVGISIIKKIPQKRYNKVISDYIEHTEYYSGHFLIYKGDIIKSIFFRGTNDDENLIRCGPITEYEVVEPDKLKADVSVFDKLFKILNYSGFACPEFTIVDNKIVMFEINPRCGGSLISNEKYCKEFFQAVIDLQISD